MRLSISRCHAVTTALSTALFERAEGETPKVTYQALGEAGSDAERLAHRRVDVFSARAPARRPAEAEQRRERRGPTTPADVARKRTLKAELADVEAKREDAIRRRHTYQKIAARYGSPRWKADPLTVVEEVAEVAETLTSEVQDRKMDLRLRQRHRREFEDRADEADSEVKRVEARIRAIRGALKELGEHLE